MAKQPKPIDQRFWKHVDRRAPNECWPWTGLRNAKGYGRLYTKADGRYHTRAASRISWEIHNGADFPSGMLACHSCDNPPCVNPDHIWPGTYKQNRDDAVAKQRVPGPPERRERKKDSFGFHAMEVGDFIDVPRNGKNARGDDRTQATVTNCAKSFGSRRNPIRKFSVKILDATTVRCWRIA